LSKPPKPLKPKEFQKVISTILMPMRIKHVPIKPIGIPQPKNASQSPTKKPEPAIPIPLGDLNLPVRMPEKN